MMPLGNAFFVTSVFGKSIRMHGPVAGRKPRRSPVPADAGYRPSGGGFGPSRPARRLLLHAWVVMGNHVHLLITPQVEAREASRARPVPATWSVVGGPIFGGRLPLFAGTPAGSWKYRFRKARASRE